METRSYKIYGAKNFIMPPLHTYNNLYFMLCYPINTTCKQIDSIMSNMSAVLSGIRDLPIIRRSRFILQQIHV